MMEIKRDILANIEQQEFRGDRTNEPSLNVKLAEFLRRRGLDAVEEQRVKSAEWHASSNRYLSRYGRIRGCIRSGNCTRRRN